MSFTVKNRFLILGLFITLLGIFVFGWHLGSSKQRNALNPQINALRFDVTRTTLQLNNKTLYLSKVEQELATQKELIRSSLVTNKELKALNLKYVKELTKAKLVIDTLLLEVCHNGEVVVIRDTIRMNTKNALLLPFDFEKKDQWLNLNGTFNNKGKLDVSLKLNADVDVVSGVDKTTKKSMVNIFTDNPYINTVNIKSYKTDVVQPKRYGVGIQFGYGLTLKNAQLNPYVGVGVHYSIIRF